jgi:hypothetical protein
MLILLFGNSSIRSGVILNKYSVDITTTQPKKRFILFGPSWYQLESCKSATFGILRCYMSLHVNVLQPRGRSAINGPTVLKIRTSGEQWGWRGKIDKSRTRRAWAAPPPATPLFRAIRYEALAPNSAAEAGGDFAPSLGSKRPTRTKGPSTLR